MQFVKKNIYTVLFIIFVLLFSIIILNKLSENQSDYLSDSNRKGEYLTSSTLPQSSDEVTH
ncbi:hypothetical protein HV454_15565 [Bacillus sporothermodurans]|uniref:hypothetical protein n=1 Tax=Heyndrickxia sporothermodurans TaxID=46224 RepID=UPI000D37795A|nr:hypothetical protein [Heyndrickxia sporothermodurans]MBL5769027.1 hypothetical protein [Heyndrickxia sporothermodurans]MBL5850638.1 hypothetical protein [Heyndrickxia sporothermodurans]MBL5867766.1 hypothetical protein [Heyndrickxia sporothermodurans]MBL5878349.1 hypothetical protein [Heyndrickxia sporothermodurans]MBL5889597.1 hypothetical protein [Heyndrickxia sporothermodurans]